MLEAAREGLLRLTPPQARVAQQQGALLVDIRGESQLRRDGRIPGAVAIERNVLEWRLDPGSAHCLPGIEWATGVVLICNEGYQSSLAAAAIGGFGLKTADVIGGFRAWRESGQPICGCRA